MVGSSDQVNIVVQFDRYKKGYAGKGNFTTAKRFYLTQDDDLTQNQFRRSGRSGVRSIWPTSKP